MASERHDHRVLVLGPNGRARACRPCPNVLDRRALAPLRHRPETDAEHPAQLRGRSLRSPFCRADGLRGHGATMTNLSLWASCHSLERIASSTCGSNSWSLILLHWLWPGPVEPQAQLTLAVRCQPLRGHGCSLRTLNKPITPTDNPLEHLGYPKMSTVDTSHPFTSTTTRPCTPPFRIAAPSSGRSASTAGRTIASSFSIGRSDTTRPQARTRRS
jgi:hypothetical protein